MRWSAIEVLPDPATPWMTSVCASASRMIAFWSRWIVATMVFMPSSEARLSSSCSTSSTMLTPDSSMSSMRPSRMRNWRLSVRSPRIVPEGAS